MGILLTLIALIVLIVILIPSLVIGMIISLINHSGNRYFINIAKAIDHFGNVLCQYLFNLIFINKNGYKFGNIDETLSSVLGKNYRDKTLTKLGLLICNILDKIDPNHVTNSIDNNIE